VAAVTDNVETAAATARGRLAKAAEAAAAAGVDVLLIAPGPDLRYLTGYDAMAMERLTCLVLPAFGDPVLVTPGLEVMAAKASPVGTLGLEVRGWSETDSPYDLVASLLPAAARAGGAVAVDDTMWALQVLRLRDALPDARQVLAGPVLRELRMVKTPDEVAALRQAGAAIDRVHALVPQWLQAGRSEREVGADIAEAILAAGHVSVDFVIVGSGPNGASPHHELSDRVISAGDPVVVDIGGTMPSGYTSDETRMYSVGQPPDEFLAAYEVLQAAQAAAVAHVRPGVSAESVDAAARAPIARAGYGDRFIHRTGHGIGLQTHEEPYIVAGNDLVLRPGMTFSVEPGIYHEGRHGARIEDIVAVTEDGVEPLNLTSHDLVVIR
jgi:Xaa-Pro aminopeptidase